MPSGRYFGFVIGGGLPAALAADWLTSAWDQNAGLYVGCPSASVVEQVVREWVCDLLGLPGHASIGFVTGTQMGSVTALAAARFRVLDRQGWDVSRDGLAGAPPVRVLVGDKRHVTIDRALRLLGLGAPEVVRADSQGRMDAAALRESLLAGGGPSIVCAQAGEVNTGAFDPLEEIADAAREHGAWLHVDGAFGLWAAASPQLRHLVRGAERADSWITDAHEWLNVPYDSALVLCADAEAHRARRARRAHVRMCPSLCRRDRRAGGSRAAQRRRAQPGSLPLQIGRAHGRRPPNRAGRRRGLDERHDVERPTRDPHLRLELADRGCGDRPGAGIVPEGRSGARPGAGAVDLPLESTGEDSFEPFRRRDERVEIDAGFDPVPREEVDEIFGCDVPRRPRRVRTAAEPAARRVEQARTGLERRDRVCVARIPRVVQVYAGGMCPLDQLTNLSRRRHADRVGEDDLRAGEAPGDVRDDSGIDATLERTPEGDADRERDR